MAKIKMKIFQIIRLLCLTFIFALITYNSANSANVDDSKILSFRSYFNATIYF